MKLQILLIAFALLVSNYQARSSTNTYLDRSMFGKVPYSNSYQKYTNSTLDSKSNEEFNNSIVWLRRSLSTEDGIPYVVYDNRIQPEDVVNVDNIPSKQTEATENSEQFSLFDDSGYSEFFDDIHNQNKYLQCRSIHYMFEGGYYAVMTVLRMIYAMPSGYPSPYHPIYCHPIQAMVYTDDDTIPEIVDLDSVCSMSIDETILLHPIIPEACVGSEILDSGLCQEKCKSGNKLCELVTDIRIGEIMGYDELLFKKILLKVGPIQMIHMKQHEKDNYESIVIYGWYTHGSKTFWKTAMYFKAYDPSSYVPISKHKKFSVEFISSLTFSQILVYTSGQEIGKRDCAKKDLELATIWYESKWFWILVFVVGGVIVASIVIIPCCCCCCCCYRCYKQREEEREAQYSYRRRQQESQELSETQTQQQKKIQSVIDQYFSVFNLRWQIEVQEVKDKYARNDTDTPQNERERQFAEELLKIKILSDKCC
ncbi:MAG: hypothetical protein EZS28_001040 [Streblomastix strix]|uniref:Uncharacterized protein n=1 Tax=Streblomastix strix TaxID=222440 RepID=A0A5J4X845_9EUKA|nr:MAG: hypothetical protein EZS28_001040 [Streblomastix strix]